MESDVRGSENKSNLDRSQRKEHYRGMIYKIQTELGWVNYEKKDDNLIVSYGNEEFMRISLPKENPEKDDVDELIREAIHELLHNKE